MKDLLVECHGCKERVFNQAVFVFAGSFQEAFCSGQCLFGYLQRNAAQLREPVGKRKEQLKVEPGPVKSIIYEEVAKAKAKKKGPIEQPPGKA